MRTFIILALVCSLAPAGVADSKRRSRKAPKSDCGCSADGNDSKGRPDDGDVPPDGKPGECYVKVRRPAEYKTVVERVLIKEKSVKYRIIPAVFKDVEQKVLVKPETVRYEVIPAKFEPKVESVVTAPKFKRLSTIAPKFKPSKEKVLVKAESTVWKKGKGPLSDLKNAVSEVWCLVREAAEYHEYTRQKLDAPAKVNEHIVKQTAEKVETQVMVSPAEVKKIVEPAEYKTVTVRELVRPATAQEVPQPAVFDEVKTRVLVRKEEVVWQRVLCETNLTPAVIRKIQQTLRAKKYDCGKANGKLTKETLKAIEKYQRDHKLARGGLTYEFLEHLKIEL